MPHYRTYPERLDVSFVVFQDEFLCIPDSGPRVSKPARHLVKIVTSFVLVADTDRLNCLDSQPMQPSKKGQIPLADVSDFVGVVEVQLVQYRTTLRAFPECKVRWMLHGFIVVDVL
ncbi:hypothetical protein D9M72_614420 [compost metagenome]